MAFSRSYVLGGASVAITAAYFLLWYMPGQKSLRNLRQQIRQDQQFLASSAQLPAELATLRDAIERAQAYCAARQQAAPKDDSLSSFLERLTRAAGEERVIVREISPQNAQHGKFLRQLPVEVRCVGPFEALGRWLAKLDAFAEPFSLDQVKLEVDATAPSTLSCTLTVTIFRQFNENSD